MRNDTLTARECRVIERSLTHVQTALSGSNCAGGAASRAILAEAAAKLRARLALIEISNQEAA